MIRQLKEIWKETIKKHIQKWKLRPLPGNQGETLKDIKQESISIQGFNVLINNLTIENEELAEYLLENGTTEEIFSGIVHAGVTHMNLLKGSIEKNLMKEQVKIIEKNNV